MAFRARMVVRFGDIDQAGIVYYPRFLHYYHVALEEFFASEVGVDYPTLVCEHRLGFPTVHLETDFFRPLRYGERIEVEVAVVAIGRTSITWRYRTFCSDCEKIYNQGSNTTVSMDMDTFRKRPTPAWLVEKLRPYRVGPE